MGCDSTDIIDELYVKWFELIQLDLPSAGLGATAGSVLAKKDFFKYWSKVGKITRIARDGEFLLNIYFEEHLNDNIVEDNLS